MIIGLNLIISLMFLMLATKNNSPKKKQKNIIYYDIETDGNQKITGKDYKSKCVEKGIITSVVFKKPNKKAKGYTIGINCNNEDDLIKQIKPYFANPNNLLVAWNGLTFDDVVIKKHLGSRTVKCDFFDLMRGYDKYILGVFTVFGNAYKASSLNEVAMNIADKKDDVNAILAWRNKEYKLLHDYNVKDVELLEKIDNKYGITGILFELMKVTDIYKGNSLFGVKKLLERYIRINNISIRKNKKNTLKNKGGLNYIDFKGRHTDLWHYDIKSQYPYLLISLFGSSNLDYTEIVKEEVEKPVNYNKYGHIWFNDDGTIQIYQDSDKYYKLELTKPFDLSQGNGDIKDLTRRLVELKLNNDGYLEKCFKVLVNGLYGNFGNKKFKYRHQNLASAVTFMGRLLMYNCINKFDGCFTKTDSIWTPLNVSADDLNKYTAELLEKYGLNAYDEDGNYIIEWEFDNKDDDKNPLKTDILYIKDKGGYVELLENEKWIYKGSFTVPAQKKILSDFILNPDLNVKTWVENHIDNILDFCRLERVTEKTINHYPNNFILTDKLGLPREIGMKHFKYYADDGYINSLEINDSCPKVNWDYALNLCTKILNAYGFSVKVHPFKDNRPKKSKKTNKVDNVTNSTLDQFNYTFNNLEEVIHTMLEVVFGRGSSGNDLNMAMVGLAYKNNRDVRPIIDKVRRELGRCTSAELTHNISLKNDGYGFPKLEEEVGEELALAYVDHLIKVPMIEKQFKLKDMKINYTDTMLIKVKGLINQYFTDDRVKEFFKFDKSFKFHFLTAPVKIDLVNHSHADITTNFKDYIEEVYNKFVQAFYTTDNYIDADGKTRQKLIRDFTEQELNPFLIEFKQLYKDNMSEMLNDVPELTFRELIDLFIEVQKDYYYKNKQEIIELLQIALILKAPRRILLELLADSGFGKNAQVSIMEVLYPNIIPTDSFTIASFYNECIENPYRFDNEIILIKDMGSNKNSFKNTDYSEFLDTAGKELISDGKYVHRKTDTHNNKSVMKIPIKVFNGFKVVHYSVYSVLSQLNDIGGQVRGRSEKIELTPNITCNEDIHMYNRFKKKDNIVEDFNIFKLPWLKFIDTIESMDISEADLDIIYDTYRENNLNPESKHVSGTINIIEPYLKGAYGADDYYTWRYKPLYVDNIKYRGKALELLEIMKKYFELTLPNKVDLKEAEIADTPSATRNLHKYDYDKYDAFNIDAVKGINRKFVKTNKKYINELLKWLEDKGKIEKISKIEGKNIYILLEDDN